MISVEMLVVKICLPYVVSVVMVQSTRKPNTFHLISCLVLIYLCKSLFLSFFPQLVIACEKCFRRSLKETGYVKNANMQRRQKIRG